MKKLLDCFDYLKRYHSDILDVVTIMLELFVFKKEKMNHGKDKFFARCKQCNISGVIVADLPFEEKDEILTQANENDVEVISLIAPTSENRIGMIANEAQGFIYCVSSLGVTGVRKEIKTDIQSIVDTIRKYTDFPASNTDFILAIVIEELGFMGFLLIAICYMVIIIRLYKYAFKMKNEKGRIVLVGVATYLFVHFLFNVGGVTGFIPLTGVPLLMISAGGTSTSTTMVAIGLGQAIISQYRQGVIE